MAKCIIGIGASYPENSNGLLWTFDVNPEKISWGYSLNTRSWDTYGGRVVQILSCSIDELTIEGTFPPVGDEQDRFKNMSEFENWVLRAMREQNRTGRSFPFSYPDRGWSGKVYIKSYPKVKYDLNTVAITYKLNLIPDEGFEGLKREVSSRELAKIVDGIDWRRSKFTDPTYNKNDWETSYNNLLQEFGAAGVPIPSQFDLAPTDDVAQQMRDYRAGERNSGSTAAQQTRDYRAGERAAANALVSRPIPSSSHGETANANIGTGGVVFNEFNGFYIDSADEADELEF